MIEELNIASLEDLARRFALSVKPGDRFFLRGALGAGKSTFARAFIRALGVEGAIPSPTFIMDSVYSIIHLGLEVHHIDLYWVHGWDGSTAMAEGDPRSLSTNCGAGDIPLRSYPITEPFPPSRIRRRWRTGSRTIAAGGPARLSE